MPIDEKILEFWTQRVMEDISGFPHLNNYFVQSKLDVIADSTNQIMETSQRILHREIEVPETPTEQISEPDDINKNFDVHEELTMKFDKLFPKNQSSYNDGVTPRTDMPHFYEKESFTAWLESLSAEQQWNFKYARELLHFQTTGELKDFWKIYDEEDASEIPQVQANRAKSEKEKMRV